MFGIWGTRGTFRDPPTVWMPVAVSAATRLQDVREMCARRGDIRNSLHPFASYAQPTCESFARRMRPVCDSFAICGDTRNSS